MNPLKSIITNLLIPLTLSLLFVLVFWYTKEIPKAIMSLTPYLFYVISILVVWVSWHFNKTKFMFIIIPLVCIHLGFEYLSVKQASTLFVLSSIFYPLHLLVFLLLKERGLFSIWGIAKIGFFAFEIALIAYFLYFPNEILQGLINTEIFTNSLDPLKDVAVVIGTVVSFTLLGLVLFNKYVLYNTSFLVILISFYLGLFFYKIPYGLDIAFLSISVVIFSLLIRESYRLAFYDELTELPGRRALIEDMAKLGMKYSFAMTDIDHFKKFNDTYGHDTGDEVLKMVASKLANVSGGGKAYRYGGEEFVVLFPGVDVNEAYIHSDVLREVIATSAFNVRNKKTTKKIFVNISIGVVQNKSTDKDPFAVMKRADNALYKAKKAGRNRVIKA